MIHLRDVSKHVRAGSRPVEILRSVTLHVAPGEVVGLVGPSGAGKTTLLNLIGGIDDATSGRITVAGLDLSALGLHQRARLRLDHIGFVFQHFHLLASLTALENVAVPLRLKGATNAVANSRAGELLDAVGLAAQSAHLPAQLSGGERQRVAIARALVAGPQLILADEPTGALDSASGAAVLDLMLELNRAAGAALLLVTHDAAVAARCHRVVHLRDGRIE